MLDNSWEAPTKAEVLLKAVLALQEKEKKMTNPKPPLVYLASPYSHDDPNVRHYRYMAVCEAAANLIQQGHLIFSPIAHSHPIAVHCNLPSDFSYWKNFSLRMLSVCDRIFVLELNGWEESIGVQAEIQEAKRLGMSIEHVI